MSFYEILSLVFAFLSVVLAAVAILSAVRRARLNRFLQDAKEFIATTTTNENRNHDIIVLGPRHSGKTSIAELWTKPWADIRQLRPSDKWRMYEWDVLELGREKRLDERFGISRTWKTMLHMRVHDYPGDDDYRIEALNQLERLEHGVLILVMAVEILQNGGVAESNVNNRYYSRVFLEAVEQHRHINKSLARVIVVFNKADLLPPGWDRATAIAKLCQANADAIARLESLFSGKLSFMLVSALDNRGMIDLLGLAGSVGLPDDSRLKFEKELKRFDVHRA